jgi:adenine-specific DNA-methyltransferase
VTQRKGGQSRRSGTTPVEVLRHNDKRANIPTNELRAFVDQDEKRPKPTLYPRDPSLDPQLVWRGKDEQDAEDLAVPTVPIYIQEKVHPRVLIENLRETATAGEPEPELMLFNDFNGIEFEDLIDFYQHEQNWANRLILGDSLLVMTSLAEKEGLRGKVQMVFIDPPYGIGFGSNWQVSTQNREVRDGKLDTSAASPSRSAPSATPGRTASIATLPICATGSPSRASCSRTLDTSSSRSATRTCTSCAAF